MMMTPRQIRTEYLLMVRRRMHDMAEELAVASMAAQGKPEDIRKQITNWSKL
jgi:hypothetical protein